MAKQMGIGSIVNNRVNIQSHVGPIQFVIYLNKGWQFGIGKTDSYGIQ